MWSRLFVVAEAIKSLQIIVQMKKKNLPYWQEVSYTKVNNNTDVEKGCIRFRGRLDQNFGFHGKR